MYEGRFRYIVLPLAILHIPGQISANVTYILILQEGKKGLIQLRYSAAPGIWSNYSSARLPTVYDTYLNVIF